GADLVDCAPLADGGGLVPVSDYGRFFLGLKARPQQLVVSVLAGVPAHYALVDGAGSAPSVRPACARAGSPVLPAVRLGAFLAALGDQGRIVDLCDPADQVERVLDPLTSRLAIRFSELC